jgi:TetR/AcrR family transcriptional regulator
MVASSDPPVARESSRERILSVAESLFAQRGYAGVGLQEVATGVGLRKSSLFHHFATKQALYDAVLGRALRRLEARLGPVARARTTPAERLDRWVDAMIDVLAEQPTTARLVLRGLFERAGGANSLEPPAYEGALARVIQDLQELLREGIEVFAFRDVSVGHAAQTVVGATVYHFASAEFGESVIRAPLFSAAAVEARKREVKQLLAAGLAPRAPSQS